MTASLITEDLRLLAAMEPEDWQMFCFACIAEGDYQTARLAAGFAAGSERKRAGHSTPLSREWVMAARRLGAVHRGEIDPSEWSDY